MKTVNQILANKETIDALTKGFNKPVIARLPNESFEDYIKRCAKIRKAT
jgi:hypothetical protein